MSSRHIIACIRPPALGPGLAILLAGLVLLLQPASVQASPAVLDMERIRLAANGHIPWQSLSPEEQRALEDYRKRWDDYGADEQLRIREGVQRFYSLPPEKRRAIEQQRRRYERMSPQERRRLREEYRHHRH
ncbi:MAG TPA: DUF3106 domain-containing protein [Gammaproteobacteria bacterium]|nr:DUF3106 domain-containing protein [Gammaproteobacteria bacterium]